MAADDRLLYEARTRNRQALIAALAGILLVLAAALQLSGPHTKVNELTTDLIIAHKRFPMDVIASVINAGGMICAAMTLVFLYGAAKARQPQLNPFPRIAALIGGPLSAISGVAYAVVIAIKANEFVAHGNQTYAEAHHLTTSPVLLALPWLGQASALLFAIAFVLTSLNAMRVGLLTRFMGYLGIFTGILVIFPIGSPVPVVQGFWLLALAYLFSGRWPNGVPPSWRSGRPEPWPSSAEMRERRTKAAGGRSGGRPEPTAPRERVGASASRGTRATTSKRKRKRRK
jgi:hypothetical protein